MVIGHHRENPHRTILLKISSFSISRRKLSRQASLDPSDVLITNEFVFVDLLQSENAVCRLNTVGDACLLLENELC